MAGEGLGNIEFVYGTLSVPSGSMNHGEGYEAD